MATVNERIEANANLVLWCVHILGPDELHAAPSHDAAVIHARELNKTIYARANPADDILCFAYAAPYPYGRDSHAADLVNWPTTPPSR